MFPKTGLKIHDINLVVLDSIVSDIECVPITVQAPAYGPLLTVRTNEVFSAVYRVREANVLKGEHVFDQPESIKAVCLHLCASRWLGLQRHVREFCLDERAMVSTTP